jgi:hypothetical protein
LSARVTTPVSPTTGTVVEAGSSFTWKLSSISWATFILDLHVRLKAYRRLVGDAKRIDAKAGAGVVGVSAVACAACCAGPILGFLAAVGVTAAVGAVLFGVVGVAAVVVGALVWGRRRRAQRCRPAPAEPVAVAAPRLPSPS